MIALLHALLLVFSHAAFAFDSPGTVLAKAQAHCAGPKKCACFGTSVDGLHITFGNGKSVLKVEPEFSFEARPGEMLSQSEAENAVEDFKHTYQFDQLYDLCANVGDSYDRMGNFAYSLRYFLLEDLFEEQLRKNGGFCNAHQNCDCEFSLGGNEMAPDFREEFEIAVSGGQDHIYTSGSSAGPIERPGLSPILVRKLGGVLGKSRAEKERFIASALKPLEAFRGVCRDFAPVLVQGRSSLLEVIKELEAQR